MRVIKAAVARVVGTFRRSHRERELTAELESHLQMHVDDNLLAGMTAVEARRRALIRFGPVEAIKERYRERHGLPRLERILQDVRYGARGLRKNPGFTATIVVTIALGIGVNAAIFTLVNAAAFHPFPLPGADRLVSITTRYEGPVRRAVHGTPSMVSYPEYEAVRDRSRALEGVAAFSLVSPATLQAREPRMVLTTLVSCNYFDVLRVRVTQGRGFVGGDCAGASAANVIVVSDELWRSAFGGDPSVVGRSVALNRQSFMVVGIAPPGFGGSQTVASAAYVPLQAQRAVDRQRELLDNPNMSWLLTLGRMRDDASLASVRSDLELIAAHATSQRPSGQVVRFDAAPATHAALPEVRTLVLAVGGVMLAAVTLVLMIACANVANLLLARASTRRHEIAVRLSIGAGRKRIVQQLLTESLMLAAIGGVAGTAAAACASKVAVRFVLGHLPPGSWPITFEPQVDWRVVAYAFGLTIVTGVTFGLVPAMQATRRDVAAGMRDGGQRVERAGNSRMQRTLVAVQVAVCLVLLSAAGLLVRGLMRAQTIDPGIAMEGTFVVAYDLPGGGYSADAADAFQRRAIGRIAAIPGVHGVAGTSAVPLDDSHSQDSFGIGGTNRQVMLEFSSVTPEYFSLLRMPFASGRTFAPAEVQAGNAIIVNESAARRLWPGDSPLGKTLTFDRADLHVVGMVKDVQVSRLARPHSPYVFLPASRARSRSLRLLVAATRDAAMPGALEAAIHEIDAQLAVNIMNLRDTLEVWRTPARLVAMLAAALGGLALLLACTGVFATVAFAVSRRVREIGIRIALGASHHDVMGLVIRQGMSPVAIGTVLGVAGGAAVSTVLSSMLFGVSPYDPLSFGVVSSLLVAVALAACWIPARRALRVNPTVALRCE